MKVFLKDANTFKQTLIKSGMNQSELARQLKVSRGYVSQILNGTRSPSPKTAKQIAEFFNIEFDDIFFIKHAC